jgi:nitroreductase
MSTLMGYRPAQPVRVTQAVPWFESLTEAWQTMTNLRGSLPAPTRAVHSAGLAAALRILKSALYLPGPSGQRRVPSAGAIFGYTTMVLAREHHAGGAGGWSLFRVTADGRVTDVPADQGLTARLAGSFHAVAEDRIAHLLVLNRPWMSIRKYGPRGYLYSRLDAAHALVNMLGIALECSDAWLQLTPGGEDTQNLLLDQARYHELCGVVSARLPVQDGGDAGGIVTDVAGAGAAEASDTLEATCWSLLGDLVRHSPPSRLPVTTATMHCSVPADGEHDLLVAGRWGQASSLRRSTRRFGGPIISADRIAATLSALGTELPTNLRCTAGSPIDVTIFLPNSQQSEAELVARLGRYGRVIAPQSTDRASIAAACMGQQHLREAHAFVLLSASRRRLLNEGRDQFEETLFRAGASGQLLYLGAARAEVGITTVGGFDPARWAELAKLPEDRELLYLAALGSEAAGSVPKLDREAVALAHGER